MLTQNENLPVMCAARNKVLTHSNAAQLNVPQKNAEGTL